MKFTRADELAGYRQMLLRCADTITEYGVPIAPDALRGAAIWTRFRQHMRTIRPYRTALQHALEFNLGPNAYENGLLRAYLQRVWAQKQYCGMERLRRGHLGSEGASTPVQPSFNPYARCKPARRMRKALRTPEELALQTYCSHYAVKPAIAQRTLTEVLDAYWSGLPRYSRSLMEKTTCKVNFALVDERLHIAIHDRDLRRRKRTLHLPLPIGNEQLYVHSESLLRLWRPELRDRYIRGETLIEVGIPMDAWFVLKTAPGVYVHFDLDATRRVVGLQNCLERPSSREIFNYRRDVEAAERTYNPKKNRKRKKAAA